MKKNVTVLLLLAFVSLCRSQSLENQGNLCILNYEPLQGTGYSSFQPQEMTFDSLHLFPNMAGFVSNCSTKFFIANNNGPITSPSYSNISMIYYSPDLWRGNSVSGKFNADLYVDYALINTNGDIFTFRNTGYPSPFVRDSILSTLTTNHSCSKLVRANVDGTGLADLVSFGIASMSTPSFVMHTYLNTTPASTIAGLTFAPLPLRVVSSAGSWTNFGFDVEAADLDGNGKDELVFVSEVLDSIYVIYSQSGYLDKQIQIPVGVPGLVKKKIVLTDINSDGKKEISISGRYANGLNYVAIYSPVIISGTIVGVAPTTGSIVANYEFADFNFGDLNADGYKDLIISQITPTTSNLALVNVYIHNRSSTQQFQFNSPIQFNLPNHIAGGLAICDVDNNKRVDVISYPTNSPSSIAILKNFTFRDSLYTVPSKTSICQGDNVVLTNQLLGFGGPFFSSMTPTALGAALIHTTQVTSGGTFTSTASFTPYVGGTCVFNSNPVVLIQGLQPIIAVSGPTGTCNNSTVILTAGGANTFTWTTASGTTTTNFLSLTPTANVVYYLAGTGADGCKAVKSGTVWIYPDVMPAISYDQSKNLLCKDQSIDLTATGGGSYLWSTGQTVPGIVVTQTATSSQLYSVLVTNSFGCSKTATFNTNYNDKCKDVIVKTGIVPGSGGDNAHLYIENIENYPDNELTVFNRWGKKLFTQKGYRNDNKDKVWPLKNDVSSGTYYYVLVLGPDFPVQKGWVEIFSN
jgi:hypothetical protein